MRLVVPMLLLCVACTDFDTPAELVKPTILAVIADPPIVTTGSSSTLDTIVVDRTGVLTDLTVTYELIETYSGVAPIGSLEQDESGVRYVAPDPVPELPDDALPVDTIRVTVEGSGETPLFAEKGMLIGDAETTNPTLTALAIGDDDGLAGSVAVAADETRALEVSIDPAPGEDATYAWYSAVGEIEDYQSNPAEIVLPADATSGWLYVVVRDGVGGVAWRATELSVE